MAKQDFELYEPKKKTCVRPVSVEVKQHRWRWIGHTCRMPLIAIPRVAVAMRWTPDGKRKQKDPRGHGDDQLNER